MFLSITRSHRTVGHLNPPVPGGHLTAPCLRPAYSAPRGGRQDTTQCGWCHQLGHTQSPARAPLQVEQRLGFSLTCLPIQGHLPAVCAELFPTREGASGPLSPFHSGYTEVSRCSQRVLLASPARVYIQLLTKDFRNPLTLRWIPTHTCHLPCNAFHLWLAGRGAGQLSAKHKHTPSRGRVCQDNSPGQTV